MKAIQIVCLNTGEETVFVGPDPIEALISQYILFDKRISNFRLTGPDTRKKVRSKVIISKSGRTARLYNFCVVL
jgi:hypothetical protein